MILFTALGKVITNGRTGLPAWGRVAIILAALALVAAVVLFGGCSYTSELRPISGNLSVSTMPA